MDLIYDYNYDDVLVTNLGFEITLTDLRKICFNKTYTINGLRFYAVDNGVNTEMRLELSRLHSALVAIKYHNDVFAIFERHTKTREIIVN